MTTKYFCDKCDYKCEDLSNWNKHIKTAKHLGTFQKSAKLLECKICEFTCNKQSKLDIHMMTDKHKKKELGSQPCYTSIITQLLNQNSELKNFIIEQANEHKNFVMEQAAEHKKETVEILNKVIEQVKPACNISNTTNNTSNKAFNINMYLNEQCKDAINFSDFINGIEVSHEDLENNAQLGFVGGVSKILIDNLKLMNRNERPIHCTDAKRETMYIKDDNKWTKEEDDSKLRSAIQEITRKSISSLMAWKRGNPESDDMDSDFSSRCIQQSMAGYNREVYYPKVIHAIAREVLVLKP
jgi:hypothetical protein